MARSDGPGRTVRLPQVNRSRCTNQSCRRATPKGTLHVIKHTELIVLIEGTVSFQHGEVIDTAHAGSILYVPYGTNHLVWNSGETDARYIVLQIGGDTKKA